MGTCCASQGLNEDQLVKVQSVVRRHQAVKTKQDLKRQYITGIAGKSTILPS